MDTNCELCTFQKSCVDGTVFLYAESPILREILVALLRDLDAPFRTEKDLFAISGDHEAVLREITERLSGPERADIRVTRSRGAAVMAAPSLHQWNRHMDSSWFDQALRDDSFTSFFQPIVDTRDQTVFAHECLIRLFADRAYSGGEIIEAALSRGRIHVFDAYARRLSIRKAAVQHQSGAKVFVNFMPSSIYDPAYCMKSTLEELSKTELRPSDVVFEVVESEAIGDSAHLRKICDYYRDHDFGIALDDVGSGSNTLQMICDLKPDYIKIDKSLVSKTADPLYYAAVGKLAELAEQFELQVIGEGIEDAHIMETMKSLGIHLMQGYYFGKPASEMVTSITSLIHLSSQVGSAKSSHCIDNQASVK